MFINRDNPVFEGLRFAIGKEQGGPAYTAMIDGKVLGCAGVVIPWPGMGIAWVTFDKSIERYGLWATRTIRRMFNDIIKGLHLYRVEAVVLTDNIRNQRWIEMLGFTKENGTARAYTPDGRDVLRYELIRR